MPAGHRRVPAPSATPAEKPAATHAANVDVCALVTTQEMSEIVGEQAFDSADGAFYALKGDTCLDIVITQDPNIRFEQLKRIATLAIGRM